MEIDARINLLTSIKVVCVKTHNKRANAFNRSFTKVFAAKLESTEASKLLLWLRVNYLCSR